MIALVISVSLAVVIIAPTAFGRPALLDGAANTENATPAIYTRQACGPMCVAALSHLFGRPASLSEAVLACEWKPGESVRVDRLVQAVLSLTEVQLAPATLSKAQVFELLTAGNGPILLIVNGPTLEISHSLLVLAVDNDQVTVFDYPKMAERVPADEVFRDWDGSALVRSRVGADIGWRLPIGTILGAVGAVAITGYSISRKR